VTGGAVFYWPDLRIGQHYLAAAIFTAFSKGLFAKDKMYQSFGRFSAPMVAVIAAEEADHVSRACNQSIHRII
jgi:hypothetical protein